MGTNYYLIDCNGTCECCGNKTKTRKHMGKSSAGWFYILRQHPDDGLYTLQDWIEHIVGNDREIEDEYGSKFTLTEWLGIVMIRFNLIRNPDPESKSDMRYNKRYNLYWCPTLVTSEQGPWQFSDEEFC